MARRPRLRLDAPGINAEKLLTPPPAPGAPPGGPFGNGPLPPALTPEQRAERRAFVESLLLSGMPQSRVIQVCRQPYGKSASGALTGLGIGPDLVGPICLEIRRGWADDYKTREQYRRTDQLTRIQNHLGRMASDQRPNWSAMQSMEKLASEIEGNLAPRRLEVGLAAVPDALAAAIAGMTEADVEAIIAEELEAAKKLRSIETTSEPVASPAP